jgi:hypothetical protein
MSWSHSEVPIHRCIVCKGPVENDNFLGLQLVSPRQNDTLYFCTRHSLRAAMAIAETFPQVAGMFGDAEMREYILKMLDETDGD